MGVRHIKPGDDIPSPWRIKHLDDRLTDTLRHGIELRPHLRRQVRPPIHLLHRHHQGVPISQRFDSEKRHNIVVAVNKPAGDLTTNDLAENTRHGFPAYRHPVGMRRTHMPIHNGLNSILYNNEPCAF